MREAGAPSTEGLLACCPRCARPTGGSHVRTTGDFAQRFEGAKRRAAPGTKGTQRGRGRYRGWSPAPSFAAAREPYPSRGLLQRCYMSAYCGYRFCCTPTASEREECMLAMLFWVLAALAVVGALAIDWGLYLLARRWL